MTTNLLQHMFDTLSTIKRHAAWFWCNVEHLCNHHVWMYAWPGILYVIPLISSGILLEIHGDGPISLMIREPGSLSYMGWGSWGNLGLQWGLGGKALGQKIILALLETLSLLFLTRPIDIIEKIALSFTFEWSESCWVCFLSCCGPSVIMRVAETLWASQPMFFSRYQLFACWVIFSCYCYCLLTSFFFQNWLFSPRTMFTPGFALQLFVRIWIPR